MVKDKLKVQTGLRVDKFVFDGFKELCKGKRLMVGEAAQRLMEACLKAGSVSLVLRVEALVDAGQRKSNELRLKGILAELRGFIKAVENEEGYVTVSDRETRIDRAIYRPAYETAVATLSRVRDEELTREAEEKKWEYMSRLSLADCFSLALCKLKKATLLTTDSRLAKVKEVKVQIFPCLISLC